MTYKSSFGSCIEEMLLVRRRSGYQLKFIDFFLHDFDEFCVEHYPKADLLTREIAEEWIHNTISTSPWHMARRFQTIRHIGTYQQSLGMNAYVPDYRVKVPKAEEPHLFTDEQLALFFLTLDSELQPTETYPWRFNAGRSLLEELIFSARKFNEAEDLLDGICGRKGLMIKNRKIALDGPMVLTYRKRAVFRAFATQAL